jgi:hypothetical protein
MEFIPWNPFRGPIHVQKYQLSTFPNYTQHTEGELLAFHTEDGGREEYSSRVRVNPVNFLLIPDSGKEREQKEYSSRVRVNPICFLLILNILKGEFFVFHTKEGGRENIPAESELIQYVSYLYS